MRALAAGAVAAAIATVVSGSASASVSVRTPSAASTAKIAFVDVGQGDGVVIRVGGKFIVSDAGLPGKAAKMDAALDALGADDHIDLAILSHGHIDHVGGYRKLVQDFHYQIDRVLASPNPKWGTVTNQSILDALTVGGGAELTWATKGDSLSLGGATVSVLSPAQGTFTTLSNIENSSLVYTLSVNGRRLLFTGDIKQQATAQLAAGWGDRGRAHIFLATHHGSGSGSSDALLAKITPRFAVISVGESNSFGHPSVETIARLRSPTATTERIYCTARNGTVQATISTSGAISWQGTDQAAPWWSRTAGQSGLCAGR
ncbi:MAG TPA: MBL fold metallo-hydrolase [Gaiellaceae bacterium]|nr:MBL fold metallo-hydrolase [Gaiellaceae bacterium]